MKKIFIFVLLAGMFFIGISFFIPSLIKAEESQKIINLNQCEDKALGFKIYCNPDWELQTEKGSILIIIESSIDLSVTATITRTEDPNLTLQDINPLYLKATEQYQSSMSTAFEKLPRYEAVHVQSSALKNPETQLSDYYIIRRPFLYAVLFSVTPKEKFNDYQVLFYKMIDNFLITDGQ